MRRRLLLFLVQNGYDPVDAANIIGVLLREPYLGPLIRGDAPVNLSAGVYEQQLNEGILYFAPFK